MYASDVVHLAGLNDQQLSGQSYGTVTPQSSSNVVTRFQQQINDTIIGQNLALLRLASSTATTRPNPFVAESCYRMAAMSQAMSAGAQMDQSYFYPSDLQAYHCHQLFRMPTSAGWPAHQSPFSAEQISSNHCYRHLLSVQHNQSEHFQQQANSSLIRHQNSTQFLPTYLKYGLCTAVGGQQHPYHPNGGLGDGLAGSSTATAPGAAILDHGRSILPPKNQPPRFHCTECNRSYSTFNGLSKHKQFHCSSQMKRHFGCKFCDRKYSSLGAMKMHIRTHTLPCKCAICGKAFSRPWLLQGHLRTHTGEKPFRCAHCGRAFADRSNLRAHLQTHSDIKKYRCKTCQKTFSRISLLSKHESNGCSGLIVIG